MTDKLMSESIKISKKPIRSSAKKSTEGLIKKLPRNEKLSTRELILRTALKVASVHGIEGLTIGELAKQVGMSKSGLFSHFKSRDELQLEVLKLAVDQFVQKVMRPAFERPRGLARVKALFKNWITHVDGSEAVAGGIVLISASVELDDRPGKLRDFVLKAQKDLILNIEKAAQITVEEGQFRKDLKPEQFAWSVYSFILGYHHFKRMLNDPKAEKHVENAFKGLLEVSKV
jgi:AcrR family transcriptional regulator